VIEGALRILDNRNWLAHAAQILVNTGATDFDVAVAAEPRPKCKVCIRGETSSAAVANGLDRSLNAGAETTRCYAVASEGDGEPVDFPAVQEKLWKRSPREVRRRVQHSLFRSPKLHASGNRHIEPAVRLFKCRVIHGKQWRILVTQCMSYFSTLSKT